MSPKPTTVDQMSGAATVVKDPDDAMTRPYAARETSSDLPTFQEAFQQAKREHSVPADDAAAEQAASADASTDTKETDTPAPTTETAATAPAAKVGKADTSALLTDEEYEAIQTQHADNPKALRRALESAFTKKTQAIAEERRSVERLQSYAETIDAYEADPEGTLRNLAEQHGLQLVRPGEAKATETATTETAPQATTADQLAEELRAELGDEYEYLVDPLSRALSKVADKLVDQRVKPAIEASTKPLKDQQDRILSKAAAEETTAVMTAFEAKHPDWKTHEDAMFAIAQTLDPKGLGEIEYLERCYQLATREAWEKDRDANVAAEVKKALAKVQRSAETTETQTRATPDSQVRLGPPAGRTPTFEEAHAAAKRGERWE